MTGSPSAEARRPAPPRGTRPAQREAPPPFSRWLLAGIAGAGGRVSVAVGRAVLSASRIRRSVAWFGLRLQLETGQAFIARRCPSSRASASEEYFVDIGDAVVIPSGNQLPICGFDHVGVRAPSIALSGQILPGLTNVTDGPRYYAFRS